MNPEEKWINVFAVWKRKHNLNLISLPYKSCIIINQNEIDICPKKKQCVKLVSSLICIMTFCNINLQACMCMTDKWSAYDFELEKIPESENHFHRLPSLYLDKIRYSTKYMQCGIAALTHWRMHFWRAFFAMPTINQP